MDNNKQFEHKNILKFNNNKIIKNKLPPCRFGDNCRDKTTCKYSHIDIESSDDEYNFLNECNSQNEDYIDNDSDEEFCRLKFTNKLNKINNNISKKL